MTLDLDALEALANAATPGPWVVFCDEGNSLRGPASCGHRVACWFAPFDQDPNPLDCRNGAFIAAARTAVPELIARVRELEAERDALRELARELIADLGMPDEDDDFDDEESFKARARALGALPTEEP